MGILLRCATQAQQRQLCRLVVLIHIAAVLHVWHAATTKERMHAAYKRVEPLFHPGGKQHFLSCYMAIAFMVTSSCIFPRIQFTRTFKEKRSCSPSASMRNWHGAAKDAWTAYDSICVKTHTNDHFLKCGPCAQKPESHESFLA